MENEKNKLIIEDLRAQLTTTEEAMEHQRLDLEHALDRLAKLEPVESENSTLKKRFVLSILRHYLLFV